MRRRQKVKSLEALKAMGYKILTVAKKTQNGPDVHVEKSGVIFRVEIKKARNMKRSTSVHPVEPKRRHDDLICIEFPSGYVLIEPMADHLKNCAPNGTRSFFGVY
jgi:hypothetical protein